LKGSVIAAQLFERVLNIERSAIESLVRFQRRVISRICIEELALEFAGEERLVIMRTVEV
jgi:hypothetical protein